MKPNSSLSAIELLGVVDARIAGLDDALIRRTTATIKKLRQRLALGIKRSAEF